MPTSLLTVTPLTASGISHVFDNIPYSPIAWFDATKISGISSGVSLSAWTDVSGQAHHLVQASATSQLVFKTNQINGLSAVSAIANSWMSVSFTFAQPITNFIVLTAPTAGNSEALDGTGDTNMLHRISSSKLVLFGAAAAKNLQPAQAISSTTQPFLIISQFSGTTSFGQINSSASSTGDLGTSAAGGLVLNARGNLTTFGTNVYGEIITYSRALSAAEISQVSTYLISKWGITVP